MAVSEKRSAWRVIALVLSVVQSWSPRRISAIRAAILPVLEAGLKYGGTSLNDLAYLLPDGRTGEYVERLKAYGRQDLPCSRCGTPIRRSVIGQRSSYWCPTCQT